MGTHQFVLRAARRPVSRVVCVGMLAAVGSIATATAAMASAPDDSSGESSSASAPGGSTAPAEIQPVALTLTATSIDGLPDDLVAGLVDVTVTDEAGREVDFSRVEPGTDPAAFVTDLASVTNEGKPFPDYFLNNAGAIGHSLLTLDEGEYVVWTEPAEEGGDFITATLTVGAGDDDAVIPPTDGGSIRGGDYLFNPSVTGAGTTVTFTNSSDNQFHHVIVMDWGTNDPALVEEFLPAFIESDGEAAPPESIDIEQVNFDFASSGVFGPGSSGTFEAPFEAGHTYAVMCFISDREGGLPHAIQHHMYDVFQVGSA
jgi:hypothetical protein